MIDMAEAAVVAVVKVEAAVSVSAAATMPTAAAPRSNYC